MTKSGKDNYAGIPLVIQIFGICLVAISIVSLWIAFYLIPLFERELYASKFSDLRLLVETAHSIVDDFQQHAKKGELEEKEAKRQALARVGSMRYGKDGYFWINDLSHTMLMHPVSRELNGKNMKEHRDAGGGYSVVNFVKAVQVNGEAFVPYKWPEPGMTTPVDKISFVKKFEPWGWVIGTGVYATEVDRSVAQLHSHLMMGALLILLPLTLISVLIAHRIARPLRHLAFFSQSLKDDLSNKAPVEGNRETRELARALNDTIERLSYTLVSRDRLDSAFSFIRTVLDTIPMRIMIVNTADKSAADVNDCFVRETGLPRGEIIGKRCHYLYWGSEECASSDCPVDKALLTGETVITEVRHKCPDGSDRFFETLVTPVKSANAATSQVVHVAWDITERKVAETLLADKNAELAQALKSLSTLQSRVIQNEKMASIGQIAAGVAHEINNPVGFVKSNISAMERYFSKMTGYLEVLEGSHPLQELAAKEKHRFKISHIMADIPEIISETLSGMERIEIIVKNLKSFSRLDGAEKTEADLNHCLDSTISIVWNEIKYNARLTKHYGQLPPVTCFAQQINQVFMNLLVNASQAIGSKGEISVTTWADESQVHISVADNGCGIAPEIRDRIFEPFFTTKPAGKGTGLGLSISCDIIRKHGGEIALKSEPGRGSEFTVSLPVTPGH
ncbi:MAG: hypothetical protein A2075_22880 [Geobacteraceae bacterium GWC2_58_44]|nr:MAG: hypothetical protein A2075_22880 [Geobacteraceae bacterium GWC2_58_44]HBG05134.1 hypothetical protein [Geobacter sp.]